MDLNLSSFGILVPAAPSCAFYSTRHQINGRFGTDDMAFANTLIWYTHKSHIDWYIHINAYQHHLLSAKFKLESSSMSSVFKNYSLAEVVYLLIRFNRVKSFLQNTKNTNRNRVKERNKHIIHGKRRTITNYFCQPLPFYGKIICPSFLGKFQPPPYIGSCSYECHNIWVFYLLNKKPL